MAKSLEDINAQIAKLQAQAQALKVKEVAGVIARIKEAIAHYGLTTVDLGFEKRRGRKPGSQKVAPQAATSKKAAAKPSRAKAATAKRAAGKGIGIAKYADGAGHTWTGRGTRPGWFKAAMASGKTADDLLIKTA